jgi:hypothetical protein
MSKVSNALRIRALRPDERKIDPKRQNPTSFCKGSRTTTCCVQAHLNGEPLQYPLQSARQLHNKIVMSVGFSNCHALRRLTKLCENFFALLYVLCQPRPCPDHRMLNQMVGNHWQHHQRDNLGQEASS